MLATIGYERADLEDFLATLMLCDIEVLVDVRDRAQSRRRGFSKSALESALRDTGIDYLHIRELGDPKEGREAARKGDFHRFREIYDGVLETSEAKKALKRLELLANDHRICLMCFERDQLTCHRKIVSDRLEAAINERACHLGVVKGAGRKSQDRRVRHLDKSATASVELVL